MHTAVRIYQVDPGSVDDFKQRVNETFLPIIKEAPGFQAYYSLDTGDGRIASVSVFDDRAGAEASTKMAADNIRQNMASLAPIPPGDPGRGSLRNRSGFGGTVGRGHGHGRRGYGQPLGGRGEEELAKGATHHRRERGRADVHEREQRGWGIVPEGVSARSPTARPSQEVAEPTGGPL